MHPIHHAARVVAPDGDLVNALFHLYGAFGQGLGSTSAPAAMAAPTMQSAPATTHEPENARHDSDFTGGVFIVLSSIVFPSEFLSAMSPNTRPEISYMTPRPAFVSLARERKSVRGFKPDPVPLALVRRLLETARTAPSGANLQPGRFVAMTGQPLRHFCDRLCVAIDHGMAASEAYSYFPEPMPKHLRERQVKTGAGLYAALGIDRKDADARQRQFMRNYRFFDAPVGLVATIDARMGKGCFMDFGMMLQTLLLAARAEGLASCGIGALSIYGPFIAEQLGLDEHEMVVCGVALGYEDPGHPANDFRTDRLSVDQFARFEGWSDEDVDL